ncbi:MAG: DUF4835 family protein [Ginsengibacter sp.]
MSVCYCNKSIGQELRARVNVNSSRVGTTVDKKTFQNLQTALINFINTKKWSKDNFNTAEKIDCSFLLNLEATSDANVYKGTLTIQSARPVFNSSYASPIINYKDNDITFKYVDFQQLEFNESRVSGSDPTASNLTAIFAYWINMILGFDYDSFSPKAGNIYFLSAQNIVNNAPEGRSFTGWKSFDGTRNRYWLVENMLNSRYNIIHDVIYKYYRNGMDQLYDNESNGRKEILNALDLLGNFNGDNPNTMIEQFFFQGKTQELIKVFSKASPGDKSRALALLEQLDITSAGLYKEQLK